MKSGLQRSSLIRLLVMLLLGVGIVGVTISARADGGPNAYAIGWYRFGDISGVRMRNSHFRLEGTLGQMAVGTTANADFKLCSGVQCARTEHVPMRAYYLPIIGR